MIPMIGLKICSGFEHLGDGFDAIKSFQRSKTLPHSNPESVRTRWTRSSRTPWATCSTRSSSASGESRLMWPDVGIKSRPIFPKVAQKAAIAGFSCKWCFKKAQNVTKHLGYFCMNVILSSLKPWVWIPQLPILQSKETGPTYLKSFPAQGLIS